MMSETIYIIGQKKTKSNISIEDGQMSLVVY
jgi:hypothetical protein